MKPLFHCLLCLLFIGCTTPGLIMKSWVGHKENELYRQWGPPSKVIDNGHDGKIVLYIPDSMANAGIKPNYVNAGKPPEHIGSRNNEYKRTKAFFISPMGNIYRWKWE